MIGIVAFVGTRPDSPDITTVGVADTGKSGDVDASMDGFLVRTPVVSDEGLFDRTRVG